MDEIRARLIAASEEEVANGKDQWVEDEGKPLLPASSKQAALKGMGYNPLFYINCMKARSVSHFSDRVRSGDPSFIH
jgi:hypothetical protein